MYGRKAGSGAARLAIKCTCNGGRLSLPAGVVGNQFCLHRLPVPALPQNTLRLSRPAKRPIPHPPNNHHQDPLPLPTHNCTHLGPTRVRRVTSTTWCHPSCSARTSRTVRGGVWWGGVGGWQAWVVGLLAGRGRRGGWQGWGRAVGGGVGSQGWCQSWDVGARPEWRGRLAGRRVLCERPPWPATLCAAAQVRSARAHGGPLPLTPQIAGPRHASLTRPTCCVQSTTTRAGHPPSTIYAP